jgi:hypothetical protein
MSPHGVVLVGGTSAAEDGATDVAHHGGVGARGRGDDTKE